MTQQELEIRSFKHDVGGGGWVELIDAVPLTTALALLRERDNWRGDAARWRDLADQKQQEASNLRQEVFNLRRELDAERHDLRLGRPGKAGI